jgi:hypothetical protein
MMRATAKFSDPSNLPVTVTLSGSLKEFEELSAVMLADLPYYQLRPLIDQIGDISRKLRGTAEPDVDISHD